jgi:hypothetical protein
VTHLLLVACFAFDLKRVNKSFKCEKQTERRNGIFKKMENHGNSDKNTAFAKSTENTANHEKRGVHVFMFFVCPYLCMSFFDPADATQFVGRVRA